MLLSSLPLRISLMYFLTSPLLLSTFKLCKFLISKIFLEQVFPLSLNHKPFLAASALASIRQDHCFGAWLFQQSRDVGLTAARAAGVVGVSPLSPSILGARG